MIELRTGTKIWIAAGVTDMRRGFDGLSAKVQTVLEQQPFSGHVFVFRGRRGDIVKLLWWDGDGLCLFAKRLERGRFIWPQATERNCLSESRAQLSMLLEGIDWRRAAEDLDAGDRGVSDKCDSPLFMRVLCMFSTQLHGILRPWIALRSPISIRSIVEALKALVIRTSG